MHNATKPLASTIDFATLQMNHKVDLIHTVISQNQITHFLNQFEIKITDNETFIKCLTHPSFSNEFKHLGLESYERLEFLGDAVLELYITEKLLLKFPTHKEGELSRMRGALVNEGILYELASCIGLSSLILTGKGESKKGGHTSKSIMADVFEALLGGIYQMHGLKEVSLFLDKALQAWESENEKKFFDDSILLIFDAKSRLQELTMAHFKELPQYEDEPSENGFKVSCLIQGKVIATLERESKKQAQREIAQLIIQKNLLNIENLKCQEK